MNQFVKKIVDDVIHLVKPDIPPKIAIQAVHYCMSVTTSIRRINLKMLDDALVPINYYGITFANSARGKDLSLNLAKPVFTPVVEMYLTKMAELTAGTDIPTPVLEQKEGSMAGILQDREALDHLAIGSTNIRVQELVATMKSPHFDDVLNVLTESWDKGSNEARVFRGYVSPPIRFVPINCLLYSSPEGFRNTANKSFANFADNMANGLARRSYVVWDDSEQQTEDTPTIESVKLEAKNSKKSRANTEDMKTYVHDLIAQKGIIEVRMTEESSLAIKIYDAQNKNKTVRNPLMKNAVKAELIARGYKIGRLAAMYAFFDGSDEVSIENVEDAIEWSEMLNKDIMITLNAETIQERIYDYMAKASKYVSETDIRKYLGISAQEFRDSKSEMASVAYANGSVIQEKVFDKEGKVIRYNLIHGNKTEPENMICSASAYKAKDFKPLSIGFMNIPDLLKGRYGINISAGQFIDKHRDTENFIRRSNLIMLDIDDGTSIEDAKLFLSRFRGWISTTRNHQKDKVMGSGVVKPACDRFRIVLVSAFEFNFDPDEHKKTIKNFASFHSIVVDQAAVEVARFYFTNPETEIYSLDGEELVDLRDYVEHTEQNKYIKAVEDKVAHSTRQTSSYVPTDSANGFDKWFLRECVIGDRNNIARRMFKALIDKKGFTENEASQKVFGLNSMLPNPLSESELISSCTREAHS